MPITSAAAPRFLRRPSSSPLSRGSQLLGQVVTGDTLPAFAIGGISVDNLEEVIAAGFSRVARGAAVTKPPIRPGGHQASRSGCALFQTGAAKVNVM